MNSKEKIKKKKPNYDDESDYVISFSVKKVINDISKDVFTLQYSPDDTILLVGTGGGNLRVYNSHNGHLIYSWNTSPKSKFNFPVTSVVFRPVTQYTKTKNIIICAGNTNEIQHWHITTQRKLSSIIEPDNVISCLDYRADGKYFASGGKDGCVRVYDEIKKKLVNTMKGGDSLNTVGHANRIFSVKFHPTNPNILLSGGWDNTIQIWDKRQQHACRRIFGPHICGDSLDILKDGSILTGSWRPKDQLQIWDFNSGKLIENVKLPYDSTSSNNCNIYSAKFSKKYNLLAYGGSGSNEMRIMRRKSKKVVGAISGLNKGIYSLTFSHDSKSLACGGADGSVYILGTH